MRARHLFLAALGVGLAIGVAPVAVDAAKRTFSFDKKGRAKVAVTNTPKVKVPGGVRVTGLPAVTVGNRPEVTVANPVTVGNRPEVTVANRPEVTVANEPTVKVSNQPSQLTAMPPVERNFSYTVNDVADVVGHPLFVVSGAERAAITEMTVSVTGENVASSSSGRIYTRRRESGSAACSPGTGWSLPQTLRTFAIRVGETIQLDFSGAPLVVGDGGDVCVGFQQLRWWNGTEMNLGVSGFRFNAG